MGTGIFAFAWGIVVLARNTQNKDRAFVPLIIGFFFGFALLFMAMITWRAADDGLQLASVPIVKSEKELIELWKQPYSGRLYGVLIVARMGARAPDPTQKAKGLSEILWYDYSKTGTTHFVRFRASLIEGGVIDVLAPLNVDVAWNWPQSKRGAFRLSLQRGDPIVILSEIEKGVDLSGKEQGYLPEPKLIAFGNLENFRKNYIVKAEFQGTLTLLLAAVLAGFAVFLLLASYGARNHIRLHGGDEKSEAITIK